MRRTPRGGPWARSLSVEAQSLSLRPDLSRSQRVRRGAPATPQDAAQDKVAAPRFWQVSRGRAPAPSPDAAPWAKRISAQFFEAAGLAREVRASQRAPPRLAHARPARAG